MTDYEELTWPLHLHDVHDYLSRLLSGDDYKVPLVGDVEVTARLRRLAVRGAERIWLALVRAGQLHTTVWDAQHGGDHTPDQQSANLSIFYFF